MNRSQDWIRQAKRDLDKAELDIRHEFFEWACFTSQQCAEKAVKAVYQSTNRSVRGHSVLQMLYGLIKTYKISEELLHQARILDRYYIESRYPNGFPQGSPFEYFDERIATEALHAARTIYRFCENIVNRSKSLDPKDKEQMPPDKDEKC